MPIRVPRIIRHWARQSMLRSTARDVVVRRIDADLSRDGGGWRLDLAYHLAAARDTRSILLFDGSGCPLPIESAACTAATSESHQRAFPRVWMFRPRPGCVWDDATVTCRLRWPAGPLGCLSIPDHVPRIPSLAGPASLPDIGVSGEAGDDAPLLGLSRDRNGFGPALLQAVLAPDPHRSASPASPDVHLSGRFGTEPEEVERRRIGGLVANLLEFHTGLFGVPLAARICIAPAESVPGPSVGALLSMHGIRAFGLAGQEVADDVMLGSRLASLWWGTGCRIDGPHGRELEAAIRGAAGMLWATAVDSPSRNDILDAWERNAARARIEDWWSGAQGLFRFGEHGRWSLRLHNALREDAGARAALARLTERCWGSRVAAEEVFAALEREVVALRSP